MPQPELAIDTAAVLRAALAERLDDRDRPGAVMLALDAVHQGDISIPDLYTLVIGPLLTQIGSAWQHGEERVWEEHLAAHALGTVVEALYPDVVAQAAGAPRTGRGVLLACPPAERHELGLRMLADRFELAGWRVTLLGADTPIDQITAAARETGVELVALSVSTVFERMELRCFIDTLREQLPGVRIVVGGPAFARDRGWPAEDLLDTADLGLPGIAPVQG